MKVPGLGTCDFIFNLKSMWRQHPPVWNLEHMGKQDGLHRATGEKISAKNLAWHNSWGQISAILMHANIPWARSGFCPVTFYLRTIKAFALSFCSVIPDCGRNNAKKYTFWNTWFAGGFALWDATTLPKGIKRTRDVHMYALAILLKSSNQHKYQNWLIQGPSSVKALASNQRRPQPEDKAYWASKVGVYHDLSHSSLCYHVRMTVACLKANCLLSLCGRPFKLK